MSRKKFNPNVWGHIGSFRVTSGVWAMTLVKANGDFPILIDCVKRTFFLHIDTTMSHDYGWVQCWGRVVMPSRIRRLLTRKAMRAAQNRHENKLILDQIFGP